jgi:hypothetical protein
VLPEQRSRLAHVARAALASLLRRHHSLPARARCLRLVRPADDV